MSTGETVKAQFTLPELQDDKLIEWNLHVIDNLGANDMIIGRDILGFLGINIKFSDHTVEWGQVTTLFKDADASQQEAYYVAEDDNLADANERLKQILDAKYEAADLDEVMKTQNQLNEKEKPQLEALLPECESLFEGTLGKWTGSPIKLKLNKDAEPYHARAFPLPKCHANTLKIEVD